MPDLLRIAAWERDLNIPAAVVFEIVWDIAAERVKEELERQMVRTMSHSAFTHSLTRSSVIVFSDRCGRHCLIPTLKPMTFTGRILLYEYEDLQDHTCNLRRPGETLCCSGYNVIYCIPGFSVVTFVFNS